MFVGRKAAAFARGGVLAGVLAVLGLAGPATASADFTWSGGASIPDWSASANWGGTSPAGPSGTLTFPVLTNSACTANPPTDTCYQSTNDLSGIGATGISIDDSSHGFTSTGAYAITGNGITLGSGGITAAPQGTASGFGGASIGLPITLAGNQTWSITGGSNGESLLLSGGVTGTGDTLAVDLASSGLLKLTGDNEVGAVTVSGGGPSPGSLELGARAGSSATLGKLNASDGNSISLSGNNSLLAEPGETGPLTASGGQVLIGNPGANPAGSQALTVDGNASLSSGTLSLFVNQAGTTAGTDYSQLSASGTVTIGSGETLSLGGASGAPPQCPTLNVGDVLTLVTAATVTGTFSNAANGSVVSVNCSGGTEPTLKINYTAGTVTATVQTAGGTTPTTTSLQQPSPANPVADQPVTLTAQVSASSGTPSGTVAFLDAGSTIPNCFAQPLSGSPETATCQTSFSAGGHSLTAQYSGGGGFSGSTSSPPTMLSVGQGATSTSLSISNSNPDVGQSITYTATVAPSQSGDAVEPSGTVAFDDGGSAVSSCASQPLTSGNTATCTIAYGSAGTHSITASYPGDANFTGSASSPAQTVTVTQPGAGVPVNTAQPTISGRAQQGQTLTVTQGTWTNSPTSIGDQWVDCDGSGNNCATNGPSGHSYTLTASDVGHTVRVVETAANASGPGAPAPSAPTNVVTALPSVPVPQTPLAAFQPPAPAPPRPGLRILANPVSGKVVGPELPSGNHGLPVKTSGSCILSLIEKANATAAAAARRHRRPPKRLGLIQPVRLAVAGAGTHYLPLIPTPKEIRLWRRTHRHGPRGRRASAAAAAAIPRDPLSVTCQGVTYHLVSRSASHSTGSSPGFSQGASISGDPVRGRTVTWNGSFTGNPGSVSFQWEDCRGISKECSAIPGTKDDPADKQSYTLQGSDVGFAVRVLVFATNLAGTSEGEFGPTNVVTGVHIPPQALFTSQELLDGDAVALGGIDLDGFCRLRGFDRSRHEGPGLYDWFCVGGPGGQQTLIDTTIACQYQYPGLSVEAVGNGNTNIWACMEHGTGAGRSGTARINVPPLPPPQKPLCRSFTGGNAGGSISLSVCNNQVLRLSGSANTGACNTETAQGNSSGPFSDSATLPTPIPLSASGSFGFNFPGATTFNGQGQVNAGGGSAGVGIGTGPSAVSGGFAFCTAHENVTLH